jgi:hypothetical protein
MPALQQVLSVGQNDGSKTVQFVRTQSVRLRQDHRIQPVLCHIATGLDMHVRRLAAFVTVEEEAQAAFTQNCRHRRC